MKHALVILSGAGDEPLAPLGGRTPLAAAEMPCAAHLARSGRVGAAVHTPPGLEPATEVGLLSLLGHDPRRHACGPGPLLAQSAGLAMGGDDWALVVDLVATAAPSSPHDCLLPDACRDTLTPGETGALLHGLAEFWALREPALVHGLSMHPREGGRGVVVDRSGRSYTGVETTDPRSIAGIPWMTALPEGERAAADALRHLMELSAIFLPGHEVNRTRAEQGLPPATLAWVWGQGMPPRWPSLDTASGRRMAIIAADPISAGVGECLGMARIKAIGAMTGPRLVNDAATLGRATVAAIDEFDLVCCHLTSPGEASRRGDVSAKVAALAEIDRAVIAPLAARLAECGSPERHSAAPGWRLLIAVDHAMPVRLRRPIAGPAPFVLAGAWVRSLVPRAFDEESAAASDLLIDPGHELMEYFLRGGLASVR